MKSAARKGISYSKSLVTETGKYALATAEYTGLLTASIAVRSGNLLKDTVSRLAAPVKKIPLGPSLSTPLKYCREGASKVASLTNNGLRGLGKAIPRPGAEPAVFDTERLARIEEMLRQIDRRLAAMEEKGASYSSGAAAKAVTREKVKLTKARDMLLRQLVEANKQLREA